MTDTTTLTVRQRIAKAISSRAYEVFGRELATGDLSKAGAVARYLKTADGARAHQASSLAPQIAMTAGQAPQSVEILREPFVKSGADASTPREWPACSSALLALKG